MGRMITLRWNANLASIAVNATVFSVQIPTLLIHQIIQGRVAKDVCTLAKRIFDQLACWYGKLKYANKPGFGADVFCISSVTSVYYDIIAVTLHIFALRYRQTSRWSLDLSVFKYDGPLVSSTRGHLLIRKLRYPEDSIIDVYLYTKDKRP